jgi:hypothetical protein
MVKKSEIQKRNLISTIEDCLKEHQVTVSDDKNIEQMFLIQMSAPSTLLEDFMNTYNTSRSVEVVNNNYAKLLSTVLVGAAKGTTDVPQTYGVLVDTNLTCRYAFNMEFADFNKQEEKVVFKPIEDVLKKCADEVIEKINKPRIVREPSWDNMVIKYSLKGGRGGPMIKYGFPEPRDSNMGNFFLQTVKQPGKVGFEPNSLLDVIKKDFEKNKSVEVIINEKPQKFYLVDTTYTTIEYRDLEKVYGTLAVSKFIDKSAEEEYFAATKGKTVGPEQKYFAAVKGSVNRFMNHSDNNYGILITPEMQMKFAFNHLCSHYDDDTKQVVFAKLSEVVDGSSYRWGRSAKYNADKDRIRRESIDPDGYFSDRSSDSMLIKYALCGPKK